MRSSADEASGGDRPDGASLEDAFLEYLAARERGEQGSIESVASRYPEHAEALRELATGWGAYEGLVWDALSPSSPAPAGGEPGRVVVEGDPSDPSTWAALLERVRSRAAGEPRYVLDGVLGRGGMGEVYHAFDVDLRRAVALKMMSDEMGRPGDVEHGRRLGRFLEEAQVTAQLDHPGIVPVHDVGTRDGRVFYAMKLVSGEDLRAVLAKTRSGVEGWNRARVLGVLLRAGESLAFAHSRGVIHRDLKPENVMVGRFGETYVVDWGLARLVSDGSPSASSGVTSTRADALVEERGSPLRTDPGEAVGTAPYMAPEQAAGDLDRIGPATDVYAFGAILYELLAGHAPYLDGGESRTAADVLALARRGPPTPLATKAGNAPAELVAVCERAMAWRVDDRYPSMTSLLEDLRAFLEQRVVAAYEEGPWAELRKWMVRNRPLAVSAAVSMALITGLVIVALFAIRGERNVARAREQDAVLSRDELAQKSAEESFNLGLRAALYGRWEEAHARYAEARARGCADEIGIRVSEIEAWEGAGALARARAAIDELAGFSAAELGPHLAKTLLLRGDHTREHLERAAEPRHLELVADAVACGGLDAADAEYAAALLASDAASARLHLERALAADSRHRRANEMFAPTLLLTGHPSRALQAAREYRRLYPDDPSAQFVELGCRAVVEGSNLAALVDAYPRVSESALGILRALLGVLANVTEASRVIEEQAMHRVLGEEPSKLDAVMRLAVPLAGLAATASAGMEDGLAEALFRIPPSVARDWRDTTAAALSVLLLGKARESMLSALDRVVASNEDGTMAFVRAWCRSRSGDRAAAAREFLVAAQRDSVFPLAHVSLVHAAGLATDEDGGLAAACAQLLRASSPTPLTFRFVRGVCPADGLRREATWRWRTEHPDDLDAWTAVAEDAVADGALRHARTLVEQVLRVDPDHRGARRLLGVLDAP